MHNDYPILQFDPERPAIIEPSEILEPLDDMPEHCVLCFFQNVIDQLVQEGRASEIKSFPTEQGGRHFYALDCGLQRPVTLLHPGIGAAIAAASLEAAIALGGRKFVACGGAGVLDRGIAVGHLVVPTAAVRDEGTSYHYMPAGREVASASLGAINTPQPRTNAHAIRLERETFILALLSVRGCERTAHRYVPSESRLSARVRVRLRAPSNGRPNACSMPRSLSLPRVRRMETVLVFRHRRAAVRLMLSP